MNNFYQRCERWKIKKTLRVGELTQIGETNEEVRNREGGSAVEAIGAFFDESGAVFKERWDICDSHEGHECGAKELPATSLAFGI